MINENYKYSELTGRIIGCAMEVHKYFGNGFPSAAKGLPTARQERIYQRALEIEMKDQGLKFSREFELPIFYKGLRIGLRRVDFFVGEKIMVELKAIIQLGDVHLAQAINYLEALDQFWQQELAV